MPLLEADDKRCEQESREKWEKFKEGVAKSEAAGFRIIKEKSLECWAGVGRASPHRQALECRAGALGTGLEAGPSIRVDDISVCLSGANRRRLSGAAGILARTMAHHVASLGMKLDLGGKALVLASDEELLKAAKEAMRVLAGSLVHAVRKLGVDCAISTR